MLGNDMQNMHFGNKLMVKISFPAFIYRVAGVCLFSWNHPRLVHLTVMSTSIKYLRSATSALLSCPPDESKPPKMLASGPIYGCNMAPTGSSRYC